MSAILLAVFDDYGVADRVRMQFLRDGFPTDRVELTACCEPGRAALEPAVEPHGKFVQYFRALLPDPNEQSYAERLTAHLEQGAATVTVHPRGPIEIARATQIIEGSHPLELLQHDLARRTWEYAAAKREWPWVRAFWVENSSHADCIYCRLFEPDANDEARAGHEHTQDAVAPRSGSSTRNSLP